jgi:hypothetical protein
MTYAESIRRKLESEGYTISESRGGEKLTVKAEKAEKTHIATTENLTVAFFEVAG